MSQLHRLSLTLNTTCDLLLQAAGFRATLGIASTITVILAMAFTLGLSASLGLPATPVTSMIALLLVALNIERVVSQVAWLQWAYSPSELR